MIRKKFLKMISLCIANVFTISLLAGCSQSSSGTTAAGNKNSDKPVTLNYWTWYPSADEYKPIVDAFQHKYPNIKIQINVMDSKAYQEKLPVALSTSEDIDVIGVQPSAMANQIKPYLADLNQLLPKVDADWASKYSKADVERCKALTGGDLDILSLYSCGAMIGYYNAKLVKDYGLTIPKTIDEYKKFADAVTAKDKNMMPAVFAGKEGWVCDELMLTVMGQNGDYYNQWRYKGASVDSPQFINAMNGFKKFFDMGIFTKDVMDLDYGKAYDTFTSGKAVTFFQGTWEGGLISEPFRKSKNIALEDVGTFALPVVDTNGKPTVRAFLDNTVAVVKASKHQEEAAKWLYFLTVGDGVGLVAKGFHGSPSKLNFQMDDSLLTSQTAKDGWKTILDLTASATADRNNVSGYSDIEGASVQKVIMGQAKADTEVKNLQKEWSSGKYTK